MGYSRERGSCYGKDKEYVKLRPGKCRRGWIREPERQGEEVEAPAAPGLPFQVEVPAAPGFPFQVGAPAAPAAPVLPFGRKRRSKCGCRQ